MDPPSISALFLTIFDDHKGQSLVWSRTSSPEEALQGIEFQSLPSGLHLVPTDTFYFTRRSSSGHDCLGVTVFENRELSEEEVREAGRGQGSRGRRMMSLGVLMHDGAEDRAHCFPPLQAIRTLLSALSSSSIVFDAELSNSNPVYLPLVAFWEEHRHRTTSNSVKGKGKEKEGVREILGLNHGIPADHPIYYLPTLLEAFGPKVCTLRRFAQEGKRIMFFSMPPLFPVSQAAWCIWALGQASRSESYSMTTSSSGKRHRRRNSESKEPDFVFLGFLGLMELGLLEGREGGWVACTSDAIFKDRPQLYDLLIDLSAIPLPQLFSDGTTGPVPLASPPMACSVVKPARKGNARAEVLVKSISYSFSDLPIYRQLRAASTSFATPGPAGSTMSVAQRLPTPAVSMFSTASAAVSSTWLWLLAYGAYETVCEVCWGVCSFATGSFYTKGHDGHSHSTSGFEGGIRLEDDANELEEDVDESETGPLLVQAEIERGRNGLRRSLAILHVFEQGSTLDAQAAVVGQDILNGTGLDSNKISLGLERMDALMAKLPPMTIPAIHIAGTNGKGSVSAMLTASLVGAGLKVGTFNSPHLVDVWDAVLVSGKDVGRETWDKKKQAVESIVKKGQLDSTPFEITTATAFLIFSEARPSLDVLVIECGMGGLRDATNVLPGRNQLCSVLTPVALDHQGFLGNTVEEIAADKLGILPDGGVLIVGRQDFPVVETLAEEAGRKKSAHVFAVAKPEVVETRLDNGGDSNKAWNIPAPTTVKVSLPTISANNLIDISEDAVQAVSPLPGPHQIDNLATVLTVLHALRHHPRCLRLLPRLADLSLPDLNDGLSKTSWRGRCSWVDVPHPANPGSTLLVLVDGAHNTAAARTLRAYIDSLQIKSGTKVTFIIGLSHSPPKTPEDVLTPLIQPADNVVIVPFSLPIEGMPWIKSVEQEQVRRAVLSCGVLKDNVTEARDLSQALKKATEGWGKEESGLVVVTGSLYLVADLYRLASA